jgi:hypothetical protein
MSIISGGFRSSEWGGHVGSELCKLPTEVSGNYKIGIRGEAPGQEGFAFMKLNAACNQIENLCSNASLFSEISRIFLSLTTGSNCEQHSA